MRRFAVTRSHDEAMNTRRGGHHARLRTRAQDDRSVRTRCEFDGDPIGGFRAYFARHEKPDLPLAGGRLAVESDRRHFNTGACASSKSAQHADGLYASCQERSSEAPSPLSKFRRAVWALSRPGGCIEMMFKQLA